ncbi:MAG: DUF2934 domain-containing protein [Acidobacteriia bacterium]|nr:DUF2934 domain-containing protein [Terriglobia bacterium]
MAKAKTPRSNANSRSKNLATMPESGVASRPETMAATEGKKHTTPVPINLEAEIRRRAYELYQERGCTPGHQDEDWLVAEQEVTARYNQKQSA